VVSDTASESHFVCFTGKADKPAPPIICVYHVIRAAFFS
jgi:hypothetical protein